jgi:hypothetical protein
MVIFTVNRSDGEEGEPEELLDAAGVGRIHRHPCPEGEQGSIS